MQGKRNYLKKLSILIIPAVLSGGCAVKERVRTSLDSYLQNPEQYEKKEVVLTASVEDILSRNERYRGRYVEITAPFEYFGSRSYWTWYIMLNDNGLRLRCYTHYYRIRPGWDAELLLYWARSEQEPVTVNGILYKDGLDIREIIYRDQIARPNVKPLRPEPNVGYGAVYSIW